MLSSLLLMLSLHAVPSGHTGARADDSCGEIAGAICGFPLGCCCGIRLDAGPPSPREHDVPLPRRTVDAAMSY